MGQTVGSTSSTDASQVVVGQVAGAHGLKGQLRVRTYTDAPGDLFDLTHANLVASEDEAAQAFAGRPIKIARVMNGRAKSAEVRLEVEGVETREDAEKLRGLFLAVPRHALPEALPGEYYGYQLVGCRVEDEQGAVIGTLRDLWRTGAPDVLVVDAADGRQHLIPSALLREVDLEGERLVVEALPGLLDPA